MKNQSDFTVELSRTAFFFDFDGTLAEIAPDPSGVEVDPRIVEALGALWRNSGGALAIVSGRTVDDLDRFLSPLKLPASGVHGLEMRDAEGEYRRADYDGGEMERLTCAVASFAEQHSGLLSEVKPGSVALHYRQRPDLHQACADLAGRLAAELPGVSLMRGKMVFELRLGGRTKADAVAQFMAMRPFAGRQPVFVGDDVTDEDAFREVEGSGGYGIKIGAGRTAARFRAADQGAFATWLCHIAAISACEKASLLSGGQIERAEPDGGIGRSGRSAATSGAP
ncbi:MAG: trehalose-phosphatase [Rhizobiaceae bacterium]|nr:trehalose-phosphatase [Rhizobiaceae bacterium]